MKKWSADSWMLRGIVVQVDAKMVAVQFRSDFF
jgi:hypothetical protein